MTKLREITTGLRFPEGPVAMSDGSVLLVEIERGTLTRVASDGRKEVVAVVLFFLSAEAGFITGQTLYVCGGLTIGAAPE